MHRDPFESAVRTSAVFGGVLMVAALIKLIVLLATGLADQPSKSGDVTRTFGFLLGFGVVIGPLVAGVRRRIPIDRGFRPRNLATGVVAGACYGFGAAAAFGGDMKLGEELVLGALCALGFGWAIASGLNQAFAETGLGEQPRP